MIGNAAQTRSDTMAHAIFQLALSPRISVTTENRTILGVTDAQYLVEFPATTLDSRIPSRLNGHTLQYDDKTTSDAQDYQDCHQAMQKVPQQLACSSSHDAQEEQAGRDLDYSS